jgi:CRP-like cAMP-binding protein
VASYLREAQAKPAREQWEASLADQIHDVHTEEFVLGKSVPGVRTLSPVERLMRLHRVPMFQRIPLDDLRDVVDDLRVLHLRAGEIVVHEGEVGDTFYVIADGEVGVYTKGHDQDVQLAILGRDDAFGEMALFENTPRTATVKTIQPTTLVALARDGFHRLGMKRPSVLMEVIRVLAERLHRADATILKHADR